MELMLTAARLDLAQAVALWRRHSAPAIRDALIAGIRRRLAQEDCERALELFRHVAPEQERVRLLAALQTRACPPAFYVSVLRIRDDDTLLHLLPQSFPTGVLSKEDVLVLMNTSIDRLHVSPYAAEQILGFVWGAISAGPRRNLPSLLAAFEEAIQRSPEDVKAAVREAARKNPGLRALGSRVR